MAFDRNSSVPTPVYLPGDNAAGRPYATLLGLPVAVHSSLPVVGDQGDILLVDFGQYYLGMTEDVRVDISAHQKFDYDESVFRLKVRLDGLPKWSAAMTPELGDSLSWAVQLDERA